MKIALKMLRFCGLDEAVT